MIQLSTFFSFTFAVVQFLLCSRISTASRFSTKLSNYVLDQNTFNVSMIMKNQNVKSSKMIQYIAQTKESVMQKIGIAQRSGLSFKLSDGVKSGIASGLAAAIVRTVLQPIDTVKTIQQIQITKIGPLQAMFSIINTRGIIGLWSGVEVTILGASPSTAIYFGIYSHVKQKLTQIFANNSNGNQHKLLIVALSATIGNSCASIFRVPYEVIKQRLQAGLHRHASEAIMYIITTEKMGVFGGGRLISQIVRDVPYAIFTLMSYEILQSLSLRRNARERHDNNLGNTTSIEECRNSKLQDALNGALAGGIGTLLTTPMDLIKTRLMTTKNKDSTTVGILVTIVKIFQEEGLSTFFVGMTPRLVHKIPANGLFFLFYEALKAFFGVGVGVKK
eukprot:gene6979-9540_t